MPAICQSGDASRSNGSALIDRSYASNLPSFFPEPLPPDLFRLILIFCHRCGATGHIAAECTTDWDVVLRKRKANAKKQKPSEYATLSYEYESRDDESDGSSLIAVDTVGDGAPTMPKF